MLFESLIRPTAKAASVRRDEPLAGRSASIVHFEQYLGLSMARPSSDQVARWPIEEVVEVDDLLVVAGGVQQPRHRRIVRIRIARDQDQNFAIKDLVPELDS